MGVVCVFIVEGPELLAVVFLILAAGLEFNHVVIPDAAHFTKETFAAAKLFYVAISRART